MSSARSFLALPVKFLSTVTLLLFITVYCHLLVSVDATNDLTIYRLAGEAVARGENPYSVGSSTLYQGVGEVSWRYLYPPLLSMALSFGGISSDEGLNLLLWGWSALSALSLVVLASHLKEIFQGVRCFSIVAFAIPLALWPVVMDGIERGQINIWIAALISVWFAALVRSEAKIVRERFGGTTSQQVCRYQALAGCAVGLAVQLKITPIFLVVPFLRRDTKGFWYFFLLTSVSLVLATLSFGGGRLWLDFWNATTSARLGSDGWLSPENLALSRLLVAIVPDVSRFLGLMIQLIVVACGLILAMLASKQRKITWASFAGALITLLVFASPVVWYHHLVWLVFPIVAVWQKSQMLGRAILSVGVGTLTLYRLFEAALLHNAETVSWFLIIEPLLFSAVSLGLFLACIRSRTCCVNRPLRGDTMSLDISGT